MKEFTITNIFKCWLKMWPITIILVLLGAVGGWVSVKNTPTVYSMRQSLLIMDERDGSSAAEYAGLANSDLVSNPAFRDAAVNAGCKLVAGGANHIVSFTASCPSNEEESKKLVSSAMTNFIEWAQDIYGKDNFKVVKLSNEPKVVEPATPPANKTIKIATPAVVMLAVSAVIAFVRLDYKVSKGNGKKA